MKRSRLGRSVVRSLLSKNVFARRPGRRSKSISSALLRIEDLECRTLLSATPTLTVTDANGTFTGKPFVATVSATVNNSPIPIGQSLNFSTYLGSNDSSRAIGVATDNFGNTFVIGTTTGSNFPATPGAYETTGAADGSQSAYVAKFGPNGNLVWSTLIDGANGYAIAVDGSDNVYIGGAAFERDFQTTAGAYQTIAKANDQAFVAKLNPSGSTLLWATFLGGSSFGEVDGIALDKADNVYIVGDTTATDFPLKNPIQSQNNGGSDAFISELNGTGTQLLFSTYLGGSGDEFPSAIALDPAGDIFIDGTTDSTDLQTTANAFQATYGGGDSDAFVAKLDPSGAGLAYLTYLGGSGDADSSDVEMAVDAEGDAYVIGTTDADTIPMVNAYQSTYAGGQDAYIAELNPSGTALVNSTYFGDNTEGSSLAIDSSGNVYIGGQVPFFGSVPTADPASTSGDLYVAELDLSTATLVYSTYLGATNDNSLVDPVGVTSNGNIVLAGDTVSASFPTLNAYQSSQTGTRDAFVAELQPELTVSYYAGSTATGTPLPGAPTAVGTYTVVATFTSTDPNYTSTQSDPVTFTISAGEPLTPTVTAFDANGDYDGSPFTATATALGTNDEPVSGTFAFTYYVGTSVTGAGTSTPPVDGGTYTVVASFTSSDPNYGNAQAAPLTFTIAPATTATSVVASSATSVYGEIDTLTATVTSAAGTPNAGTVTFYNGATPLGTAGVTNGVATFPATTLTAGVDVVTATYNGDGLDFAASSSIASPASIIQTIAGTGVAGFNGNNQSATNTELNQPDGVVVDSKGDLFIADQINEVVWEVNATTHVMTIVAGTGVAGYNGDGIAATSAELNTPTGLALDSKGDLFIADYLNDRVREVSATTGLISTVAGRAGAGYNGDGIAATSADLNGPIALAFDSAENLYIVDSANQRIREVSATTGLISTVAGTGAQGYNGEGILATHAELNYPRGIAIDAAGDIYISDSNNAVVREVSATTGLISAVAGTATEGYNGDGIAATSAELTQPIGIALDSAGNLYIIDLLRVREVSASTGLISTIAGTGIVGYNGDGIPAGDANVYYPFGIAVDSVGDLFISDSQNNRVREIASNATLVSVTQATPTVAIDSAGGTFTGEPLPADATVAGVVAGVDDTPGSTLEGVPLTLTYYAGTDTTGTPLSGAPTDIGTYTVVASFPGSQDYTSASASDTFSISGAVSTPSVTVTDANGPFTGQPFPATVSVTVNNAPIPIAQSLNFSTYLGSSSTSRAINVTTDDFGNTFVTGWTNGTGFPTTAGAYETTGAADGSQSAFVAKFDASGNLVWSTLIDGAAGFAIAVDSSDNVYVAGRASRADFQTTTGAYQTTANASTNAFIAELNASGSKLVWATFLGGSDFGEVDGIAVDGAGHVYVSGDTTATDFPLKNPIQALNNGGSDAFISELNSTGSQLIFSTYLGGSGDEFPSAIALDAAGDIFLTGSTDSTDLQTTANAVQPTYGGSSSNAFVAKLDPSGAGLAYLTYLGGEGDVFGSDVEMAVDAAGDAYVVGTTDGDTIPMVNAYQSTYSGGQDAFIAELNPSGTAILNSTYFGGGTYASGMALDSQGNVYIAGPEFDSVPTVDPVSTSGDLYVAEINLSTSTLVYSTTLGATDSGAIITPVGVTSNGNIILAGDTSSESFPTLNATQSSLTGFRDAFVTGLEPELTISYYAGATATGTPLSGPPSAMGTYTVVATFTSIDPNYTNAQSAPVTFTITPAAPINSTVTASDSNGTYDGSPFTATATAVNSDDQPVSGTFDFTYYVGASATGTGTSTPPVDAGTYTVVASFTSSDSGYNNAQSQPLTFTISPASPTVTINSAGGTFTGNPIPAEATVAGVVAGVDNTPGSTLEGVPLTLTYYAGPDATGTPLSGPPTDTGTYTVVASFPGSQDYTSASATDTFSISSASNSQQTPVISVNDPSGTFTGQPFVATVSATVNNTPIPIAQSLNFSTYLGSSTTSRAINVTTDDFGNTFVVGWTNGTGFPTTAGAYETTGAADGSRSAFVAKVDPSGNLVWSTLIDGASGFAIAVDGSDNVYVGGDASQTDFQTTADAYQTTASSTNAFIAKLNPSGSSLIWATYLGGNNFGEVDGIAVDNAGNVYVAGDTTATNFPLKNPIQSQNNGGSDAFVSELNSSGSRLVFSTYGGGSGDDFPSAIALDAAGDIFVTGTTDSTDLPTTANAIQPTYGGGDSDAFVAKLDPSGAGLAYLTYLGGSGDVTGSDVEMAVDAAGDAYVVGTTDADTIPMVNAYQSTYSGGQDAFIAELNPSGTAILNSTYFGSGTYASGMALDSQGNVYIAGPEFDSVPTVDPASTSGDLYVAEINLSSSTLAYSTTLGATDDNSIITPVGVTSNGNIILAGDTQSESFPTLNAYQSSLTGSRDAFVTGLQPELTVSYYAGSTATGTPLPGAPSAAGTYTVVATFTSTDPNYTDAQSDPVTFTISPAGPVTPTVTAFDSSGVYDGSPFTATATAQGPNGGPASGTFAFTYYDGTSATGTGTSTPPVDAGTYTVVASFASSDPDFTDAQSAPVTFTISPSSTATSVSASASTETYGESETLAATITSRAGTPNGGTVTFFDGTTPLGTASVTNGTASLTTTALPAGLDVVSATYSGDGLDFPGSTSVLTPSSIIQTVAGTGVEGSNPGGIPATSANLFFPSGLAVDSAGDIYIADEQNNVVQEVNAKTGLITTIAGTGTAGYNGDGIAATSAELNFPSAVHFDAAGDLFIVDAGNNRIREVNAKTGLISTVVGTGTAGYNGDGIAATSAELNFPLDITFDSSGNLYITDSGNNRVREVNASTGLISTIAGTGTAGYNGDGISAASAELNEPDGIAVNTAGDVFVTEVFGERVREISAATGLIGTIAGTGTYGYNGDGIAAISAQLAEPEAVVLDAAGNIYIADAGNSRIREIDASTGLISTVVGTVTDGYNGDGIPADTAELVQPADLAFDSAGDLFIADLGNSRVREVSTGNTVITVTPAIPTVTASDPGGIFNGGSSAATATVAGVVAGVDNTPSSALEGVSLTLNYYAGTTATGTPLPGAPSAAGTYTVVATFPGSQDYSSASDSATFSISRALPVISVSDAGGIFNGSSFPATATIAGIVSGVDNTPGSSLEGVPLTLTYYAGTSPTGTPLSGAPTSAGSYTVAASFAGSTDYLSLGRFYSFVIFQAAPVFTVSDAGGTFNGSPFPGTGTVAGVVDGVDNTPGSSLEGINLTLLYFAGDTLSGTPLSGPPSTAGSYAIEAYFPGSTDYSAGGKGYFFVISQASPVLSVSDPSGTYNAKPFAATATVAGIVSGVDNTPGSSLEGVNLTVAYYAGNNITGTPLSGPPTDAGTYTALASFPGSTDYRPTSDADVFTISPATPTINVTDAGGPATGQPYAASATAKGVGGASVSGTFAFTYYVGSTVNGTGSSTPPTSPGTYTVTAAFTSSSSDYSNASGGPVTFTITQPPPTVSAPSAATLYQNGSLTFSTANGNAISISDSVASGTSDSITLSVTHGVLKFATTTGLKFSSGSNNSASMTATGTLANLNADLQTLKYTPTSGYNGPDAINIKAADSGDGLSGTATVNLTVFGPPILTAPSTSNVNENASLVFSSSDGNAVTLTDAAATATSDSLTLTVTHGTLSLGSTAGLTFTSGSNNSTTMTVTGTLSSLQAALSGLTYTPTTSYSGSASLTVKVKDSASGFNATATVAMTVVVPASQPTVTVSTQIPTSVPGEPVPLVITVSDSNSVANSSNFSLSITFGDGKSAKVTSTNALIVNHVYTKAGTYTVSVTATDEYGHVSTVATTTINVVPAAIEINPFNPSQTALFVGGTTGKDTVTFTASGNGIAVTLNKVNEGAFTTSGPLIVFGQGGADVVNVGAGITNTSYLLETTNADNVETDLDNDAIQWAGLSAAVEILNE